MSKMVTRSDGITRKVGREFKLNPQRARKFYRALLESNTITNAAAQIHTSIDTVNRWRAVGGKHERECNLDLAECTVTHYESNIAAQRRFYSNCRKAIAKAESKLVENIRRAGKSPQAWVANAWILERRNPDEWGKENKLNVNHSGTINEKKTVSVTIEPAQRFKLGQYLMETAKLEQDSGQRLVEGEVIEESD